MLFSYCFLNRSFIDQAIAQSDYSVRDVHHDDIVEEINLVDGCENLQQLNAVSAIMTEIRFWLRPVTLY